MVQEIKRSRDFVLWAVFFYHIVSMVVKIELEVRMAVKIVRVLNTNAVVSSDQEGRELIITGAGIGFKKKKGENLDEALADKTYYLESVDDSRRLQEVVKEISERIFGDCKPYRKDSEGGRIESQGFPVCDTYRSYQFRS